MSNTPFIRANRVMASGWYILGGEVEVFEQAFAAYCGVQHCIGVGHYPVPPHLSGAYAADGWGVGDFPITEQLARSVISLPIGPNLGADASRQVCTILHACSAAAGAA